MVLFWFASVVIESVGLGWTRVQCDLGSDDDTVVEECMHSSAVYRICSTVVVVLSVQGLFSLVYLQIHDSYWIIKILFCVGASAGLLVPAADFFDDSAFKNIARIGGFIFIIFLQTILLDFAYYWKESWLDSSSIAGRVTNATMRGSDLAACMKSFWLAALAIFSLVYIAIFVVAMAVLLSFFGGSDCSDNESVISISLVMMVAALVIQLFLTSNGSIIASGILASYVAYLTYTAVSLNPDRECNPTISTEKVYGVGPKVIGLVLALLSITWTSVMASRRIASILGAGGITQSGVLNVVSGSHSGSKSSNVKENLKSQLRVTVMNFNMIFILLSFYIAMILTNWGTIVAADDSHSTHGGNISMWMQAVGAWIAISFYIVGLLIPQFRILPRSVWDLQPKA